MTGFDRETQGHEKAGIREDAGRVQFALLLACFFLSGLTALIYQTAWTREFSFVFGASELAMTTVLAAYMGGLALGAGLAGRLAPRILRPVRVYALLELGIAISALLVPFAIHSARALYVAGFGGHAEALAESGGIVQTLFYLLASFVILLIPTTLMGATLPLLAGHAVRSEREVGSRIGALYSINTAGAVAGTLLAAFILLPTLGLRSTIWIAVALNGVVFLAAAGLSRATRGLRHGPSAEAASTKTSRGVLTWILPMIMISGVCSFIYEVMWVRLLGHLIGSSVYSFATMLASFLVGIALGSSVAAKLATSVHRAIVGFGISQLGIALTSVVAFASIGWIADATSTNLHAPGSTVSVVALSMFALLPSALCIGATFPFAVRIMARGSEDASSASARVYSWNTVGSIMGSILAGFVLLPMLRFAGTLQLAVGLNLVLAVSAAGLIHFGLADATVVPRRIPRILAGLGSLGLALLIFLAPGEPWSVVRSSPIGGRRVEGNLVYYAVGRGATVMLVDQVSSYRLSTNGLPESEINRPGERVGAAPLVTWLGNLPGLLRPQARSMLVVGLGGGVMIEHIPPTIETIDVVELEAEVLSANRAVAPYRGHDPLSDPRVSVTINDARTALMISGREFDTIISQPSHPWTAGSSHLYTRDFFQLTADHLTREGLLVQWMGMAFIDRGLFRVLVATLADVFPHVQVYAPVKQGLLLVASKSPIDPGKSTARALALARDHYRAIGVTQPEDVIGTLLLDDAGARRFAAGAEISTDDFNILQTRSPRILGSRIERDVTAVEMIGANDALRPPPTGVAALPLIRNLAWSGRKGRALAIARSLPDGVEREIGESIARFIKPTLRQLEEFVKVLEKYPANAELRAVALWLKFPPKNNPWVWIRPPLAPPLTTSEGTVTRAAALVFAESWDELAGLDAELAALEGADPNHRLAVRIRVLWRLLDGDPERAREAISLLDALPGPRDVRVLFQRAKLGELAGDPAIVLGSISKALERTRPLPASALSLAETRLEKVPGTSEFASRRALALARIEGRRNRLRARSISGNR